MSFSETKVFLNKLNDMIQFLIPYYVKEGKTQLIISIGCTGGKHRSVAISQKLYSKLRKNDYSAVIEHRDIDRDDKGAAI